MPHKSTFIFDLASEFDIPLRMGEQSVFEDEEFLAFAEAYRSAASKRDEALAYHLTQIPTVFRVYLPYTPSVFGNVQNILWYLDEVVVRDPVEKQLKTDDRSKFEQAKSNLRTTIQILYQFRDALAAGYLLLFGSGYIPGMGKTPDEMRSLLSIPGLASEIDGAVRFGMVRRPDSRGEETIVWDAQLESGFMLGWFIEHPQAGVQSPPIQVGEQLPEVSVDELASIIKSDPFDQVRSLYPREIHRSIRSLGVARRLESAVLFNRSVDASIVSAAGGQALDSVRQDSAVGTLNLVLPYLEGVSPQQFVEIRQEDPEAFRLFRNLMAGILAEMRERGVGISELELRHKVDIELQPHLRDIKITLESTKRKLRYFTSGATAMTATGLLAGHIASIGAQALIPLAVGTALGMASQVSQAVADESNIRKNPVWFLWKATR